ncbi:MAG: SPOR domain-containing protein [Spirochaetota bacterium]|nr:SPOR domain-containing protein [Spirochaetota bacterium]
MQNMDHYTDRIKKTPPHHHQFYSVDPEFIKTYPPRNYKDEEKSRRRARGMIFIIIALCIASYTVGLVMGIKFASGSKKEIVDEDTKKRVTSIGEKVTHLIKDVSVNTGDSTFSKKLFPREKFPFVIRVGENYNRTSSHEIASSLSNQGHTVILSKNKGYYRVYVGPYRNKEEAEISLKKIELNYSKDLYNKASIFKR